MRTGQVLVVVLLALAVALTVGLAIVSRNITEVGISTTQDESARALSAAESGIEAALGGVIVGGSGAGSIGSQGATYAVKTSDAGGGRYVSFPGGLLSGETTTLFLADYDSGGRPAGPPPTGSFSGRLDLCWGDPGRLSETPAIEAELYYYTSAYQVKRLAYDPAGRANGLSTSGITVDPGAANNCPSDRTYKYAVSFNPLATAFGIGGGNPVFLRIRMLYNPTLEHYLAAGADAGGTLPTQGVMVESTGRVGQTARKVQVFQRYPDMGDVIDYTVYSGGDLTKQQ